MFGMIREIHRSGLHLGGIFSSKNNIISQESERDERN